MSYYRQRLLYYLRHPRHLAIRLLGQDRILFYEHVFHRGLDYLCSPRLLYLRVIKGREYLASEIAIGNVSFRFSNAVPEWFSRSYAFPPNEIECAVAKATATERLDIVQAVALYRQATTQYDQDKFRIHECIELLEQAFSYAALPTIGQKLADLKLAVGDADGALATYRRTFEEFPDYERIWYFYLICALRYADSETNITLLNEILARQPDYALALFFKTLFEQFQAQVSSIEGSIAKSRDQSRRGHVVGLVAWGGHYVDLACRYTLSALMAGGNLPALSEKKDVHIVFFTDAAGAEALKQTPVYEAVCRHCRFHIVVYPQELLEHFENPSFEVTCHVKFGLMSNASYASLEASRRLDCDATIICGDNLVNDAFLTQSDELLEAGAHCVSSAGFRLPVDKTLDWIEKLHRGGDGFLRITGNDFATILRKFLPTQCFVKSRDFARFPLFLCWKVEDEGVLAYANHYHPHTYRARYLKPIPGPSIDPVDGRFLLRHLDDIATLHPVNNRDICLFDVDTNPLIVPPKPFLSNPFSEKEVAFWLSCTLDPLREMYFMCPIEIPVKTPTKHLWRMQELAAQETIKRILAEATSLENRYRHHAAWLG